MMTFDEALKQALISQEQGERSEALDEVSSLFTQTSSDLDSTTTERDRLLEENKRLKSVNSDLFFKYASTEKPEEKEQETKKSMTIEQMLGVE